MNFIVFYNEVPYRWLLTYLLHLLLIGLGAERLCFFTITSLRFCLPVLSGLHFIAMLLTPSDGYGRLAIGRG